MTSYILCATPRTGSTLLCDLLTRTGIAGAPDSFVMENVDPVWAAEWGLPDPKGLDVVTYAQRYLDAIRVAGRGATGVFGLRLMKASLPQLLAMIDRVSSGISTDKARLETAFGPTLFVHLSRRDKLAQAVSMVKAEQSGLWHIAPDGRELERLAPAQEPVFDAARIAAKLAELKAADEDWLGWFQAEGITPLRLFYEDLAADPAGTLVQVLTGLGLSAPAKMPKPETGRLSDTTNAAWIDRFKAR